MEKDTAQKSWRLPLSTFFQPQSDNIKPKTPNVFWGKGIAMAFKRKLLMIISAARDIAKHRTPDGKT